MNTLSLRAMTTTSTAQPCRSAMRALEAGEGLSSQKRDARSAYAGSPVLEAGKPGGGRGQWSIEPAPKHFISFNLPVFGLDPSPFQEESP